ncbi:MAG TPA: DEAD/DEAH box helicase [candidate division CPR3 bacterium]|uniref:DEAD/DEAH box helicase n=1 Tax=candidate division CPR3 bacterium TaxID=2268181 RepID=A0A7C1NLN1_UNCC3|nr:DEAD/DEAH box helicase [candidate division CPR3 bacterium]
MELSRKNKTILIAGITPYFLEKGNLWFEENKIKIVNARKSQSFFQDNLLPIHTDEKISQSAFLRSLDELGYEKVLHIEEPGEFSVVGGTVEVFPINTDNAFQIEFIGNRIEEILSLALSIEDEEATKKLLKKKLKSQKLFSDLKNLKDGDYLVHLDHGIGKFTGFTTQQYKKDEITYYTLEYASKDKLYVPKGLERKLSRYVGFRDPHIARLGSPFWQKTKRRIKEEVEKLAKELLELYAKKEMVSRLPYIPEDELDQKIAASFPYEETPDQIQTLLDINKDLSSNAPMDRIVAGDVGFGKTEIALRTMARAVKSGYQAILLAPTTILAHQHYSNFKERLNDLPINIALFSRLQTKKEQAKIIKDLKEGRIDIVVGTHRLLSKDVEFNNLGLLVIDDEQKFGVKQKEKLRELRSSLDVLSLSATPIPRTLYMALSSLKGVSTIQTPPEGRIAVKTIIGIWNENKIKEAIEKELDRKGQIYFLHNRIGTIEQIKEHLEKLVPKAKIQIAHGRMNEVKLIEVLDAFRNKEFDILLSTTIIENGMDIQNVNTIIVDDAAKLGLAQAYQLKGRVGRSHKKAYAHFFHKKRMTPKARLRLKALKEAEELGSGYRLALRDLEIRGAGNILGKEQSGSINTIGLNLFCQMLSQAVERLK